MDMGCKKVFFGTNYLFKKNFSIEKGAGLGKFLFEKERRSHSGALLLV